MCKYRDFGRFIAAAVCLVFLLGANSASVSAAGSSAQKQAQKASQKSAKQEQEAQKASQKSVKQEQEAKKASQKSAKQGQQEKQASSTAQKSDHSEMDEWKAEYEKILLRERKAAEAEESETGDPFAWSDETVSQWYLYDIDKNGTPELILEMGMAEAVRHAQVYTYSGGKVREVTADGEAYVGMGHTSLYTMPEENGILLYWGHMGMMEMYSLSLTGTSMKSSETIMAEDLTYEETIVYTLPSEVIDGTVMLTPFSLGTTLPLDFYEEYMAEVEPPADDQEQAADAFAAAGSERRLDEDDKFFRELREKNGNVYVYAIDDRFMNSPGKVSFNDLLEEGVLYDYSGDDLQFTEETLVDMNGDGISEQVLYLANGDGSNGNEYRIILSREGKTVYAYADMAYGETGVDEDGVMYREEGSFLDYREKAKFRGKECFTYYIP